MSNDMKGIQWFDNARIYHVMVDRFNGGWQNPPASINDFCGGNLRGVIDKLDYIKSLGFNAIMLTPFLMTAGYHGYHTLSYDEVDPRFGTWDDFRELLAKAHDREMRVICDFVPNHCHYRCAVFQESLLSNGGKHRDWFFFTKEENDEYVSFLNLPDLPKFNLESKGAANFMISKAVRLAEMGVDGFRIDHAIGQPFSFLKHLRQTLKNVRNDIVVFGEVWADGISEDQYGQLYFKKKGRWETFLNIVKKFVQVFLPFWKDAEDDGNASNDVLNQEHLQTDYVDVLDGVLDFKYREILIEEIKAGRRINKDNRHLREKLAKHFSNHYPFDFKLVLFLDNHDTNRFLFECQNDISKFREAIEFTKELQRPFSILYGTEQLMTTETSIVGAENYADLRVRQCMDWTRCPTNILNIGNNNVLSKPEDEMPVVNGSTWNLDQKDKSSKESKDGNTQSRKMAEKNKVVWLSVTPKWDVPSLVLNKHTREQLNEIAAYISKRRQYVEEWGINRFQRNDACICINFYGCSGVGKSIAAEAVANACGRKVIKVSYSQIQSSLWGGTENNLTSLFEEARKKDAVIILNEADGLFSRRRSDGANSDTNNQIKCHLLNLMDTYEVILVLTTNRFEDYDEAFYRRTMFQVEFLLPNHDELIRLWQMHLGCSEGAYSKGGEIPKNQGFSFENISNCSEGLSGGDIRRITLAAMGKMLAAKGEPLLTEDMLKGLIEDYVSTKKRMNQYVPHEVVGKEKEEILNVMSQK